VLLAAVALLSGCLQFDLEQLASDEMGGRPNNTPASVKAQDYILGYLTPWTEGANPAGTGRDAYLQPFTGGANVIGILPGTDLAHEYVMVGAHYDGLGSSCRTSTPGDTICNGATDNAAGAAIVLDILRNLANRPTPPRRSVIFAFWDREEDGLLGSRFFVDNPLVPLSAITTYVNFDIQGANLRPSVRNITFAIGSETGGPVLTQAVASAKQASTLDTRQLSLIFGLGRSDHAVLAGRNVPTVFFSDATGPCYHTNDDEVAVVDIPKLHEQSKTAQRLAIDLADRDDKPTFVTGLPLATFADAQSVQSLVHQFEPDIGTFSPADQQTLLARIATIDSVVAAGPAEFDNDAMTSMLLAANDIVNLLTTGPCDGFLAPPDN
jgi:Zn-dependent M28 family amino/carboxypeptidase